MTRSFRSRRKVLVVVLATTLLPLGAALYAMNRPSAAAHQLSRIGIDVSSDALDWIAIGACASVAIALLWIMRRYWRCPACNGWPGRLNAQFCQSCGAPLWDQTNDGRKLVRYEIRPVSDEEAHRKVDKLRRQSRTLGRLRRWRWWGLGSVALVALTYYAMTRSDVAGLVFIVGVALVTTTAALVNNRIVLAARCPFCAWPLADSWTRCTGCGAEVLGEDDANPAVTLDAG